MPIHAKLSESVSKTDNQVPDYDERMFEKVYGFCIRPLFWNARQGYNPPFLNAEGYILGNFDLQNPPVLGTNAELCGTSQTSSDKRSEYDARGIKRIQSSMLFNWERSAAQTSMSEVE